MPRRSETELLALASCLVASAAWCEYPQIPELAWEQRSDWINVRTDVRPRAVGDGVADDTAAIQTALDMIRQKGSAWSTAYLPPGAYRITKELRGGGGFDAQVNMVGHGRTTRLVWDGAAGGRMYRSDGAAYSWYVGLVWDGRGRAAKGLEHDSEAARETKVMHRHEAFMDFTDVGSGTAPDKPDQRYLEGSMYENCLFIRCGKGLALSQWNDYVITLDGCEFYDCGWGVWCRQGGFYARNCHFERSANADMANFQFSHGCSARRCTSVGSRAFIQLGEVGGWSGIMSPFTVQDCHVSAWTNPDYAIFSRFRGPLLVFDCVFTLPPSDRPPIWLGNPAASPQALVHSCNTTETTRLFRGPKSHVTEIPPGRRKGCLTSARQRFFKDAVRVPKKVFDAKRDFGARGDGGADDGEAIQAAIDAARNWGNGAIAYLPRGSYTTGRTLRITGGDYYVGGAGFFTRIAWKGQPATGPIFRVSDPQDVTMERLTLGSGDAPPALVSVRQVSTGVPSLMRYEGLFVSSGWVRARETEGGFEVVDLPKGSVVIVNGLADNGRICLDNCADARILVNRGNGVFWVKGTGPREGLIGVQSSQGVFVIEDNQSIVGSDCYAEQTKDQYAYLRGAPGQPEGRVTLSSPRLSTAGVNDTWDKDFIIDNYRGRLCSIEAQCDTSFKPPYVYKFVHAGTRPLSIVCVANIYGGAAPTFEVGPAAKVTMLGCLSDKADIGNVVTQAGLLEAAYALDHLRELGEHDLALNHPVGERMSTRPRRVGRTTVSTRPRRVGRTTVSTRPRCVSATLPKRKHPSKEALATWDACLRACGRTHRQAKLTRRLREGTAAGRRPEFHLQMARAKAVVESVGKDGVLKLTVNRPRMELDVDGSKLTFSDKRSLAVALAREGEPSDHCVAAFYLLFSGEADAAGEHLLKGGEAAKAVEEAFR